MTNKDKKTIAFLLILIKIYKIKIKKIFTNVNLLKQNFNFSMKNILIILLQNIKIENNFKWNKFYINEIHNVFINRE